MNKYELQTLKFRDGIRLAVRSANEDFKGRHVIQVPKGLRGKFLSCVYNEEHGLLYQIEFEVDKKFVTLYQISREIIFVEQTGRGSGRTVEQMIKAPYEAIYVWYTHDFGYPNDLAKFVGRSDLQFVTPTSLTEANYRRFIVVDHACYDILTKEEIRRLLDIQLCSNKRLA